MLRRTVEKILSLILSLLILGLSFFMVPEVCSIGVSKGADIFTRLSYSFVHANFFHALINVWCFLSIIFMYEPSWKMLLSAFVVAVCVPNFILTDIPTVGLSAFCFTLLGSLTFLVKRKLYFQGWMAFYMAIGFLIPNINGLIHLYGYVAGVLLGFLNIPLSCLKK